MSRVFTEEGEPRDGKWLVELIYHETRLTSRRTLTKQAAIGLGVILVTALPQAIVTIWHSEDRL